MRQEVGSSRVYRLSRFTGAGPKNGVRTLGDLLNFGEMDWERLTTEETMHSRTAALNHSSGTTGLSKGCMLTVYNIVAQCEQQRQVNDLGRQEVRKCGVQISDSETNIAFLPFYHACLRPATLRAQYNTEWRYYVRHVLFLIPKFLRYIPKYRITTFPAVPPVAVLLAKETNVRKTDFSSVHSVLCGYAPLGVETQLQAEDAMNAFKNTGVRIRQGWRMSEGVCGSCIFALDERNLDVSGVGYVLSGMSARIIPVDDSESSVSFRLNEEGEVLLKGPNMFPGYWRKEKERREAFTKDGWYKTGDIGVMKRNGIMHIVDRKKELINVQALEFALISKAFQVAPAELEDVLLKSPDVEDVAVIGIPGEGTGKPRAYIVPSPLHHSDDPAALQALADDISRYVETRLAKHKRLTGGVVFVDIIPKNPSGKILRRQLRDRAKGKNVKDRVWVATTNKKAKL